MTAKEAIIRHLLSRLEITNLVGQRIRPNKASQDEQRPYIVVRTEGASPKYHATGDSGFQFSEIRVVCHGRTETDAAEVAEAVRTYSSGRPAGYVLGTSFWLKSIMVRDIIDVSQSPSSGDEMGYPAVSVDMDVMHQVETNTAW